MQNNRTDQEKKIARKKYLLQLDQARESIENKCPSEWRFILNHIKNQCRLKKVSINKPDNEMARLYYLKREMTQLYSELGGFHEDEE
jgi:hypothetical protein